MKLKITHYFLLFSVVAMTCSMSLKAEDYDEREMQSLISLFDNGTNWEKTGLIDPSSLSSEQKMDHLKNEGIIAVENGYVTELKLNASYTGSLELTDFRELKLLEVKETSLSSFSMKNIPLENLHLDANIQLGTIHIEDCNELEKVLVTPYFDGYGFELMSLNKVEVLNCKNLKELDLSGIIDRPANNDYLGFNDNLKQLTIKDCISLTDINCATTSWLTSIDIDTPEKIKRINAWQCPFFNDFSSFISLEDLTCDIDNDYRNNLPLSLKKFTLSTGYHTPDLDLSFLPFLEELNIFGTNIYTLEIPASVDKEKSDFRYNRFSNEELKKIFGNITNEVIEKYKIFPQMRNRYKGVLGKIEYAEVKETGKKIDLSSETYEGTTSLFKWYKLNKEVAIDLQMHDLFIEGSYYSFVKSLKESGKLEHIIDGPVLTPIDELDMEYIFCVLEPEGYDKWDEVDPGRYYLYQIALFPELKYQLKVEEKQEDFKNGDFIQIEEGKQVTLFIECDIDDNPLTYYAWNLYGSIDGGDNIMFPSEGSTSFYNWVKEVDLSSLTKGKHEVAIKYATFEKSEVIYSEKCYNEKLTIQVGVEDPDPTPDPPTLQYKVRIEGGTYYNVRTGGTTTEYEGTDVYLGIIPDPSTGDIEYDEWKITYTDPSQEHVSTEKKAVETLYEFNPDSPHNKTGDYVYTTTRLHLYKDGGEVEGSPFTVKDPYTISIVKNNPAPEGIYLQYKVKINNGSYFDVPTGGKTIEKEGTDVRLGIIPVNESGTIVYDEWKISYNSPYADAQSSGNVDSENLFEFNPNSPHNKTGEYPYLTYRLHLYQGGKEIENSPYMVNDPYTIIITDVSENPLIKIHTSWTVCPDEKLLRIPYELLSIREKLEYKIIFCNDSEDCVFEDMKQYEPLPKEGYFTVIIPENTPSGSYRGEIFLRYSDVPDELYNYPFYINIPVSVKITQQPEQVINLCKNDNFNLSVEVSGTVLGYQWFHDGNPIKDAHTASYSGVFDESVQGEYYVEVMDSCSLIYSDTVMVSGANIWIHKKWDDVLFVYNSEGIYTSLQWYKNGNKITAYGQSEYYTEGNMSGVYTVRAYRADGSYEESCPYVVESDAQADIVDIFPNPIKRNTELKIRTNHWKNGIVQIMNLSGIIVYSDQIKELESHINVSFSAGVYIVFLQSEDGNRYTEKMIVTE